MEEMIQEIVGWLKEAGELIKQSFNNPLEVDQKTDRKDLVTNMDKKVQSFLIDKIRQADAEAKILAEEDDYNSQAIDEGRVYVIDPIDGTLNFVVEKEEFCIMLAIFEEGIGKFGFIFDVMRNELYWGGPTVGVYCNERKLSQPKNLPLADGLVGMNAYMYAHNRFGAYDIGEASMGVRISGCAGLEMIAMLKGTHHAYVSNLSPWDYAPGIVLLEVFGFKYSRADGTPANYAGREPFIIGTEQCYQDIFALKPAKNL